MKKYEIRFKNSDGCILEKKKQVIGYVEKNRDEILGIFIIKNNNLHSFVTNEEIINNNYILFL